MSYFQETEFALLQRLLSRLSNRAVLDVGSEKGSFVAACLAAGSPRVFAIEPYPPHVALLRERFADVPAVTVLDIAIGADDRTALLHVAHDATGMPLDYHHSLVEFEDRQDIRWQSPISVRCRSLDSLAADGSIPHAVGLLKIDTEGGDLQVLLGARSIESAVVAVECWKGLSDGVGDCPYDASEVATLLGSRGYHDFVLVKRHDEFEAVQVGSAHMRDGDWGNLVFLHHSVRDGLVQLLHDASAPAWDRLIDRALWFRNECAARLALIETLDDALEQARRSEGRATAAGPDASPEREPRTGGLHSRLTADGRRDDRRDNS